MSLPVVLPVCDPVCGACGVVRRAGESGALRRRLSGKQKFCACGSACTRGSEATVGPVGATASEPVASVACWSQPPNSDAVVLSGVFFPLPSSAGAAGVAAPACLSGCCPRLLGGGSTGRLGPASIGM